MNEFLKAYNIHSKKEAAAILAFYFFSFTTSILASNLIAAAIDVKKTGTFCDEHNELCDKYQNDGLSESSLTESVKSQAYMGAGLGSLLGGMLAIAAAVITIVIPKVGLRNRNSLNGTPTSNETATLLPNTGQRCSLFKKWRENVLPTKFDVYQLFMTTGILIAGSAFTAYFTAALTIDDAICPPQYYTNKCENFFQNAVKILLSIYLHFRTSRTDLDFINESRVNRGDGMII